MKNQEPTQEPNKATGNLEGLFRHHLADAAVPPAPRVWEQVDNALLLAQNHTYRRHLRVARWVAAASLLLASLAGTGWWVQRSLRAAEVAAAMASRSRPATTNFPTPASQPNAGGATLYARPGATPSPDALAINSLPPAAGPTSPALRAATGGRTVGSNSAAARPSAASLLAVAAAAPAARRRESSRRVHLAGQPAEAEAVATTTASPQQQRRRSSLPADVAKAGLTTAQSTMQSGLVVSSPASESGAARLSAPAGEPAVRATAAAGWAMNYAPGAGRPDAATMTPPTAAVIAESPLPASLPFLTALKVSLAQVAAPALPAPLASQSLPPAPAPTAQARRWRLGLSYAAGGFQSNVNFSRASDGLAYTYNPALGANSPALSEAAAAEYQAQQHPGLSQRLRLQLSRHLRGHWHLATGLEVAQQESYSATSYLFTGEQVPDLSQPPQGGARRATSARYRTAGLPLELRYANSAKTGFSLYVRAGVVVSALLASRTDVEGSPEATRTYGLMSASTPYRRVLGTVRSAVGVQFRPASHDYTLSLGPVAEGGLWSLNAHPAPGFFSESRPYSFGLEAGVEFGRGSKPSPAAKSAAGL